MNNLKVSSLRIRSTTKSTGDLQGSKVSLARDYGGLGKRYYNQLGQELDRILQVDTGTGITETKGSVRGRGIQLALEMKRRGIVETDIVLISSRNHADQTIVVLATLFLGAIVAPLDPEFSYKECLEIVKKLKPKMCFCDTRTISQMERIFLNLNFTSDMVHFGTENGGSIPFSKLFIHKEEDYFQPVFIENPRLSVAFILPTQGTCCDPKLICLSHHNIFVQTMIFLDIFNYPEKSLIFFPLSWILQTVLTCVSFEAQITRILPATFTERSVCKIIHDFAIGHAIFGTDYAIRIIGNVALKVTNLCL
ncbi:hypothetical protein NQ314_000847 [Rhamnusium bicolor]|uniref:AMP-dependent synthetase/ligase domain-containing protein n=1 Tax=Rhamnusium bicolor TaxID=1586634 RepID=A0AAV8ZVY5_9CUCU|nr:hypothetical protein NQ314_000847 [Rhamnusium bicolor]